MKEHRRLLKNMSMLSISSIGTKAINFFFIPIYTSMLSLDEYGAFDLVTSTISLLLPLLSLSIADAVVRFSLEKDCDHKEVFSASLAVVFKGSLVFGVLVTVNYVWNILPVINENLLFFVMLYFAELALQLLQSFSRGMDRMSIVASAGLLQTISLVMLNVLLLVYFKCGLKGFFVSHIVSCCLTALYIFAKLHGRKYIKIKNISPKLKKDMVLFSSPLVLNAMSWWIVTGADRYIVTMFKGTSENGVYSVAYKIPTMLSVIQHIFNSAWQVSATKVYDPEDKDGFFATIYRCYNASMVMACTGVILLTRMMARLLYAKDFFDAWRFVPFLAIAVVFGSMLGFFGGIFNALKDTKMQTKTTVVGAIINVLLSLVFVPTIGAMGAAISTMIVYFLMWSMAAVYSKRYIKMKINYVRDCISYVLLLAQAIVLMNVQESAYLYLVQILFVIAITILNLGQLREVFSMVVKEIRNRKKHKY